jgi:hypothetical protein
MWKSAHEKGDTHYVVSDPPAILKCIQILPECQQIRSTL